MASALHVQGFPAAPAAHAVLHPVGGAEIHSGQGLAAFRADARNGRWRKRLDGRCECRMPLVLMDDDELFERMLALAPAKTAQPDQQMLSEIAQAIGVNTDTREVAMLPSGKG